MPGSSYKESKSVIGSCDISVRVNFPFVIMKVIYFIYNNNLTAAWYVKLLE